MKAKWITRLKWLFKKDNLNKEGRVYSPVSYELQRKMLTQKRSPSCKATT